MGCGNSSEGNGDEEKKYSHKRAKVSIRIQGNDISRLKCTGKHPPIVFVFGGPGSKKGRIVDDLVHMYGFRPLIVEDLIMRELPKKVQNILAVNSTKALADVVHDNPNVLNFDWVMEMLISEIQKEPKQMHLVDLVPNLKFILRCEGFLANPEYHIKNFHEKFPDIFALNLAINEEKVMESVKSHGAKHPDKMKEGGKSDEADSSRTQRRHLIYANSVKGFLQYFKQENRLVSVDVSCGVADLIWNRVSDFFGHDLEISPIKTVNTVVFFGFDEYAFAGLDMERYHMELVKLAELVDQPEEAPLTRLVTALCKHIDNSSPLTESFAVDASGTTLVRSAKEETKRVIKFFEEENMYLDRFIFISKEKKDRTRKNSLYSNQFKAITTTENEVCLFDKVTDTALCQKIGNMMGECRNADW